jgi:predicted Zn-ribbon and HTH transcriptional regulator
MVEKNCPKCGYKWQSRTTDPKACPRCKTRLDLPSATKVRDKE